MKNTLKILITVLLCLSVALAMSACDEVLSTESTAEGTEAPATAAPTEAPATDAPTEAPTTEPEAPAGPVLPADPTVPAGTQNALVIRYSANEDGTVTATVSVEGNVSFAGLTGDLNYDSSVLSLVSSQTKLSGMVVNTATAGTVSFSYAAIADTTAAQEIFSLTFSYSGNVNTSLSFSINPDDFCNASFENVGYSVFGTALTIG